MLDLNDIVVFARVVEAGSFTAAARLLGMQPPHCGARA
jgi:DNA-binding transcriptional LysR family regulator